MRKLYSIYDLRGCYLFAIAADSRDEAFRKAEWRCKSPFQIRG